MNAQQAIWIAIAAAGAGALFNGIIAGGLILLTSHLLTGRRERSGRRAQLRMELYHDVVKLIIENEKALASRVAQGTISDIDLQVLRLSIRYRIRLFGSNDVRTAYEAYHQLVFKSTELTREAWPPRHEVDESRDNLVTCMEREAATL